MRCHQHAVWFCALVALPTAGGQARGIFVDSWQLGWQLAVGDEAISPAGSASLAVSPRGDWGVGSTVSAVIRAWLEREKAQTLAAFDVFHISRANRWTLLGRTFDDWRVPCSRFVWWVAAKQGAEWP